MKIAFTTLGDNLEAPLNPSFGRAPKFLIYDLETNDFTVIDNNQNLNAAQGAGVQSGQTIANSGAQCLISGHCGPKAFGFYPLQASKYIIAMRLQSVPRSRFIKMASSPKHSRPMWKDIGNAPKEVVFKPIGIIHSEHVQEAETPAQPVFAEDCYGVAEIFSEYTAGLKDIEDFSHIYIIYHLHKADTAKLLVKPFLQDQEHGIFATRSPWRPNAIGISIVELVRRNKNVLHLKGVDILDGTPILDIKPYSARFDHIQAKRSGWLDDVDDITANERGKREYAL